MPNPYMPLPQPAVWLFGHGRQDDHHQNGQGRAYERRKPAACPLTLDVGRWSGMEQCADVEACWAANSPWPM